MARPPCSLSAGSRGEISAHLAEIYGTSVSKETISAITDRVLEAKAGWQARPLDRVYFIDAIVRHKAPCDRVEVKGHHCAAVAAVA